MELGSQAEIARNLKRIWNIRKKEMRVTQALAATQLNWTQGALSQYLNGITACLLYTSPSPRDRSLSRMPSSA